jgi:hypothetical protein
MHNIHSPKIFGIVAILIFFVLVALTLGTGNLSFPTKENIGTPPVASGNSTGDEVTERITDVDGFLLSPSSQVPLSSKPDSTPTFYATGTHNGSTAGTATPAPAVIPTLPGDMPPDVVLVKIDLALMGKNLEKSLQSVNTSGGSQIKEIDILQVVVPKSEVAEAIASLSDCPGVSYAEPDYIARMADTIPSDPGWANQYGLLAIHAPQNWDKKYMFPCSDNRHHGYRG